MTPLPDWVALLAGLLLIAGGLLAVIGSSGLLRLRSFYARMHPVTMGATLGMGCILVSSILVSSVLMGRPAVHELVITVFLVITSPVSAITLMRAALSRTRRTDGATASTEKP
jgi:multicomponent K+:H+ antiporter subunit G